MSALKMTLTGDKEMKKNLERVSIETPLAARRGTREWAQELLDKILPGVPYKTGKLAGTGKVRITIGKRATLFGQKASKSGDIAASIVFGGREAPYARLQHETNPTHKKFLERPLIQAAPTAGAEIAEKIALKKLALK